MWALSRNALLGVPELVLDLSSVGARTSVVAVRVEELADRGDQCSSDSEGHDGIRFSLTLEVFEELFHGTP